MRNLLYFIPIMLLISGGFCQALDNYPVKVYPCQRTEREPCIDGVLEKEFWDTAPLVSRFTYYNRQEIASVQTSVRLLYDSKNLYLGIVAEEPKSDQLSVPKIPKDGDVFGTESIEFFIDPHHDQNFYYQFAMNVSGSLYDAKINNTAWDSSAEVSGKVQKGSWSLEFVLPWKSIGVKRPKSGSVIGFNVCRNRYLKGQKEWTNWSQTKANFHDPVRFAHLVLSPTPEQLGMMEEEFRKGDRTGPLRIYGPEGFSRTSYRALASKKLKKIEEMLKELKLRSQKKAKKMLAEEIERRLGQFENQVAVYRRTIESDKKIDAKEWVEMELELDKISRGLSELIWEARLAVLLSRI